MDRTRDRRDEYSYGGGESYRPSNRGDFGSGSTYRKQRSPVWRDRSPPRFQERFHGRRRSRSPAPDSRRDVTMRRDRSPPRRMSPRRAFSPRRDERRGDRPRSPLSPRRRRVSRSPVRARSPPRYRRDQSPTGMRLRSPPRTHRREFSPQDRVNRRPHSPSREPRLVMNDNARRRERSSSLGARRTEISIRMQSPTTSSRRSSPPMHPDRVAQSQGRPGSPPLKAKTRSHSREPAHRTPMKPQISRHSPRATPPHDHTSRRPSPRRAHPGPVAPPTQPKFSPPTRPARISRADESRAPYRQSAVIAENSSREPPSGPSSFRQAPTAPLNRTNTHTVLDAPTRPRGAQPYRHESRDNMLESTFPNRGGGRPPPMDQPRPSFESHFSTADRVPSGPRAGSKSGFQQHFDAPRAPSRSNSAISGPHTRTQRFTNHLAALPVILPGGKALPPFDPAANKKLTQLEEDAMKLRRQIDERQKQKRAALRDWDMRERESKRDHLRSELAESQLEAFSGGVIGGQAF